MKALDEYILKSGQSIDYVLKGSKQYGIAFITDVLVPKALAENKIIIWKAILTDDFGKEILLQWNLKDADLLKGNCELAIVANIIGEHPWGENKEIKSGTKHFRAGTKVYFVFMYGGMGHESVRVYGKPRKSFKFVDVVLRRSYLTNFRVQKVYSPHVLAFLDTYLYYTNNEIISSGLDWLNQP